MGDAEVPDAGGGQVSLYRHEVRRAAVDAVVEAVSECRRRAPEPLGPRDPRVTGRARPLHDAGRARDRLDGRPDRRPSCASIRAAEGHPGVLDTLDGAAGPPLRRPPRETALRGRPGDIVAQRHGAICRATVDGAVWITHLKPRAAPAGRLQAAGRPRARARRQHASTRPRSRVAPHALLRGGSTYREIAYEERDGVGYLRFDFYNGAMSTDQCRRLLDAFRYARSRRETRVIVLEGGDDFFSNGIHLNVIEAAADPASESWANLVAIDDVVREVIETGSHLVVSALAGDAAAGGVPLALAADHVVAREDVVLNPYYAHMGGLFGSEYWTYLLPRRVGAATTARLTSAPFEAIGTGEAVELGLLDDAYGATAEAFRARVDAVAAAPGGRSRPRRLARGQAAPAGARRAAQAAARVPDGGARPLAPVLLRRRHRLPRGAPALRPQAGRAVRGAGRAGAGGLASDRDEARGGGGVLSLSPMWRHTDHAGSVRRRRAT